MASKRIELGDVAKDTVSGFEGVVIAETKWLHGCRRLTLKPQKLKDGKAIDADTFDEPQCVLVKRNVVATSGDTGGDAPAPVQKTTPSRR